jgi:DNA (cytosine-5)-methyltransferase 1
VPTVRSGEAITLREALGELLPNGKETDYSRNLKDSQFWGLSEAIGLKNVTQRRHGENTQLKFELYIALKNLGLSSKLMKADKTKAETAVRDALKDELRTKVSYPIFKSSGEVLASSPEEFEELLERFKTRKHSQRVLELDKTPPTVITSPDDYLHPLVPRVLSVRELARFQGFSDHFEFYSKETTGGLNRRTEVPQYSQVGNAVSPFVSKAFGKLFASLLANAV